MSGFATPNEHEGTVQEDVTEFDRWLVHQLLKMVGNPNIGIQLWDGYQAKPEGKSPENVVKLHDRGALFRVLHKPSLTFGILFTAGRISVRGDLVATMEDVYEGLTRVDYGGGTRRRFIRRFAINRPRSNSLDGSKENIHSHYDLGNDFYELWLDRAYTQYTCAYFPTPELTLEQAQMAKLELVCRKLALQPGETVVEAGSGWGGLARYLAKHYGVNVRSYNISTEQVAYARNRAAAEGLADKIEYVEDDYRNIKGKFDVFVSIGMLEHVGTRNYEKLGAVVDRCLKPDGRGLIHSIGQIDPRRLNPWIERYVFPGGEPPTLRQMTNIFEPFRFVVTDVDNLRSHYAQTLRHWWNRFEENADTIEEMFDERFVRAWRLYLCGSTAGFTRGGLQLYQVLFKRPQCTALPDTRAHLFEPGLVREQEA